MSNSRKQRLLKERRLILILLREFSWVRKVIFLNSLRQKGECLRNFNFEGLEMFWLGHFPQNKFREVRFENSEYWYSGFQRISEVEER